MDGGFLVPKVAVEPRLGADSGAGGARRAGPEDFLAPSEQHELAGDGLAGQRVAFEQASAHIGVGAHDQRLERHDGHGIVRPIARAIVLGGLSELQSLDVKLGMNHERGHVLPVPRAGRAIAARVRRSGPDWVGRSVFRAHDLVIASTKPSRLPKSLAINPSHKTK